MLALVFLTCLQDPVPDALEWLGRHQGPDGSWGAGHHACDCFQPTKATPAAPRDAEVGRKVATLVDALASDSADDRERATADLIALGRAATPFLEDAINNLSLDPDTRERVKHAFSRTRKFDLEPDLERTSLALLSLLGAGYTHLSRNAKGPVKMGAVVKIALQWLLKQQKEDGSFGASPKDGVTAPQVLAALAVSQAYGKTLTVLLKDGASRGTAWVVSRQRESGAWGDGKDDLATSVWAALLLKNAHLNGSSVERDADSKLVAWLEKRAAGGGAEDTAAFVLASRLFQGRHDVAAHLDRLEQIECKDASPFLRFVATRAFFVTDGPDGKYWNAWSDRLLLLARRPAGGEDCVRGAWGAGTEKARATMLAALTYETYYR